MSNERLTFSPEMQKNMIELYLDITSICLDTETPDDLAVYILQSSLWESIQAASAEMDPDIRNRMK